MKAGESVELDRAHSVAIATAERLSRTATLPRDLDQLNSELRLLPIKIDAPSRQRNGGLVRVGRNHQVVVYRSSASDARPLSSRERFTVAHEIGHYVVEDKLGIHPGCRGEYWGLEDVCNEFAARVLMPDWALEPYLEGGTNTALGLYQAVQDLMRRANVSMVAASRRLVPFIPGASALEVREGMSRGAGVAIVVQWAVEAQPIFTLRPQATVRPNHILHGLLPSRWGVTNATVAVGRECATALDVTSVRPARDRVAVFALAREVSSLADGEGEAPIHPLDHVNMSFSLH